MQSAYSVPTGLNIKFSRRFVNPLGSPLDQLPMILLRKERKKEKRKEGRKEGRKKGFSLAFHSYLRTS